MIWILVFALAVSSACDIPLPGSGSGGACACYPGEAGNPCSGKRDPWNFIMSNVGKIFINMNIKDPEHLKLCSWPVKTCVNVSSEPKHYFIPGESTFEIISDCSPGIPIVGVTYWVSFIAPYAQERGIRPYLRSTDNANVVSICYQLEAQPDCYDVCKGPSQTKSEESSDRTFEYAIAGCASLVFVVIFCICCFRMRKQRSPKILHKGYVEGTNKQVVGWTTTPGTKDLTLGNKLFPNTVINPLYAANPQNIYEEDPYDVLPVNEDITDSGSIHSSSVKSQNDKSKSDTNTDGLTTITFEDIPLDDDNIEGGFTLNEDIPDDVSVNEDEVV